MWWGTGGCRHAAGRGQGWRKGVKARQAACTTQSACLGSKRRPPTRSGRGWAHTHDAMLRHPWGVPLSGLLAGTRAGTAEGWGLGAGTHYVRGRGGLPHAPNTHKPQQSAQHTQSTLLQHSPLPSSNCPNHPTPAHARSLGPSVVHQCWLAGWLKKRGRTGLARAGAAGGRCGAGPGALQGNAGRQAGGRGRGWVLGRAGLLGAAMPC